MRDQPFHHGNLRAVLLERAEEMLRERGGEGLSLREVARRAGVSHGAPRSHFVDRQSLQDALAERGFTRLTDDIVAAISTAQTVSGQQGSGQQVSGQDDFGQVLRAVGTAYVRFAVTDAALLELMFAAKGGADPSQGVLGAVDGLVAAFGALIDTGVAAGWVRSANPYRTKLLFAATMQGIASLVAAGRITAEQGDDLIVDATDLLTR